MRNYLVEESYMESWQKSEKSSRHYSAKESTFIVIRKKIRTGLRASPLGKWRDFPGGGGKYLVCLHLEELGDQSIKKLCRL